MKKLVLLVSILWIGFIGFSQNVGINTDGSSPDASAMLDVKSSNKGFLAPRVASTGDISSPATGLLVYQTGGTPGYYYYNGASWVQLGTASGSSQWTTSGSNIYYNTGNVGIGTTNPLSKLSVEGGAFSINSGFGNTSPRPAVGASRIAGEIAGTGSSFAADDGFLRMSAGGGTNSATKTFIDLSGYSTVSDMAYNIVFGTTGTERMRINYAGKVGIGTSTPSEKLDVDGVALSDFEGFSYYVTELAVSAGAWTDMIIPTLDYNTFPSEPYNTSNGTFTAPRSGYYRFSIFGYATTAMTDAGDRYAYGIKINNVLKSFAGGNYSTSDTPLTSYSAVVYLTSGAIVKAAIFSSIDVTLGGVSTGHAFWFQGEYVGK